MARQKGFNKNKYQDIILREVNNLLRTKLSDKRLRLTSITKVELSSDYAYAKLYWDTYDANQREESKVALAKASSKIRTLLSQSIKLKHTPEITFIYDLQFDSEQNVIEILDQELSQGKHS